MLTGVSSSRVMWQSFLERYTRLLMEANPKFPIYFLNIYRCLFHTYTTSDAGVGATLVVARGRAGTRPAPTRPWMGLTPHRSPLPGERTSARQGSWCRTYEMDI